MLRLALPFLLATAALAAYIPKQPIHIQKGGGATYSITGKNTAGPVDVKINDKGMFAGFRAEGKNGDKDVNLDVSSAGLGAGWRIKGKIGDEIVEATCREDGAFGKTWTVKGKIGDRAFEAKADAEWEIDPAAQGVFILFDCCEEAKPATPKSEPKPAEPKQHN
jgi:hypothetical protein